MKVRIDEDLCVGCGLGVNTSPDIVVMKDDKAIAKVSVVPGWSEESAKQSKDECPVEAIIIG
mgnify:CR=1 FL=1